MPPRGQLLVKHCSMRRLLARFGQTQDDDTAVVCLQEASFWSSVAVGGGSWQAFGKIKTMMLPKYASKVPGWKPFGKPKAIILPEYDSEMPGLEDLEKLEAMRLPEYASEMPGSELLRHSEQ